MQLYWANFLHIYQPPDQSEQLVKKIANESYIPLILGLEKNHRAKLTVNISGSLTELLARYGFESWLRRLGKLAKSGQIELTESAKYHPILPLLPDSEIIRQINLNHQLNQQYLTSDYKPLGFYPPEMAYSAKLGKLLAKLGFGWVILDEIISGKLNHIKNDRIFYQHDLANLKLLLRNRRVSNFVSSAKSKSGTNLINGIRKRSKSYKFVITAMDGETFGHHNKGYEKVLFEAYNLKKIVPVTLSELIKSVSKLEEIEPKSASWSTSESDLRRNVSFSLWNSPGNAVHKLQWQLTRLAIDNVEKAASIDDPGYPISRHLLDCGLHSDQYWWASGRIIFRSFLLWSVDMIEAGAKYLKQAICDLHKVNKIDKDKAHELYDKILSTAFAWQRQGIIAKKREKLSKRFSKK